MNNSYITIIKEKRTVLSRKRVPLNQNECTADFGIGVPFEQNLQSREILIALCMAVYDRRYLRPFNFGNRIWTIHHCTDYYKVHAPILNAAKHCVKHWTIAIIHGQMSDTFEGLEKAWHYYNV